jgi:hypothetical protein
MKKNTLSTALVMSLAGVAGIANISNAVTLNPDGTGNVLLYPYYTVNANNQTIFSVVNTTAQGKAVKVRILEGRNSREVLDFNLYLSAFDVWTAGIFSLGTATDSPGALATSDNSCTSPNIRSNPNLPSLASGLKYAPFVNYEYTGNANDSGLDALERTREGYIELIEMGSIANGNETGKAITHVGGTPRDCAAVDGSWNQSPLDPRAGFYGNPAFGTDAADVGVPTGGLFGGGAVVNAGDGTYTNYNADALDGFSAATAHTYPGSTLPNFTNADPISFVFNNGTLIRSTWGTLPIGDTTTPGQRIDAVSAVYMSNGLLNEFTSEAAQKASSEWIITFPTKSFYVDRYRNSLTAAIAPFTRAFSTFAASGAVVESADGNGSACESVAFQTYDREEGRPTPGSTIFSPPPPLAPSTGLCFEAQVLAFNQAFTTASGPSKIMGSKLARNIAPRFGTSGFDTGWLRIDMRYVNGNIPSPLTTPTRLQRASAEATPHRFVGLPSTGFWAVLLENTNARPGVQGFYGGAYTHRRGRECGTGAAINGACL